MRTLIFLGICAACVGIAIAERRDRSDRRKVVIHGAVGLVVGYVLGRMMVWAGAFGNRQARRSAEFMPLGAERWELRVKPIGLYRRSQRNAEKPVTPGLCAAL